ncbi:MAG: UvrD-helicase domain-containing protein [Longicatena sp.]
MPNWNSQQLKAIHTKDKNILVSASAGSGKTTVLIARLMDLVMNDHVSINAILAMTFTEAAANEMKKRLAAELQNALACSTNEDDKRYITKQLTSIQTAHISTIHSFCLSILQDYYYTIGLSSKRVSSIMDNGSMVCFQKEALKQCFQNQYQKQDETFLALCQMFSARPESNSELESMILRLASLASSKADASAWLSSLSENYHNIKRFEDLDTNMTTNFFEYFMVEKERYVQTLLQIEQLYNIKYSSEVKKHAILKQKIDALPVLTKALETLDYYEFRSSFISIAHASVPTTPDKEDKEYERLRKRVIKSEDDLLGLLFSEDEFMKDNQALYPYINKLVEMCIDYREYYAQIKEQNEVIDFDDMEHFALAILQANNGDIARVYRNKFIEIMVDEFQDSNDVQNKLVSLICKENNVFRVGDIKQSIYGFRHALPQLMKGLITNKGIYDEVIYLSNNYRSKKMIVDFNNELFKRLMNIEGFSCSYEKEDDVETGVESQLTNNAPICFHALFHDEVKDSADILLGKNELKASYIANQIITIKEKEQRDWKDFVVLVRGNARKDDMKAAFDEVNIPYFIDIKYGFYQSNAVQIMLSALKCMVRPHDDISFIATLVSPLFNRTTQELAEVKLKKDKKQSYYSYYQEHPFEGFEILDNFISIVYSTPLTQLLNALYEVNQYYSEHTTMQEKTNLDLLFEKAVQFEDQNARGITSFLTQIEQIKDAQTAEAIPIGSDANVVRVMSIHQSKGLQFRVVFLWSTNNQTPIEFKDYCLCDSDLGIAMKYMELPQRYVRTTMNRIAMEHKKDKEELEEEMRILYVATTRAQEQMHIVDCITSLDTFRTPLTLSSVYERNGYTAWILQAFLNNPSPLFTLKEVHQYWHSELQPIKQTSYKQISHYQKPTKATLLSTPSTSKDTRPVTFSLEQNTKGSDYGTLMHTMLERLPLSSWTKEEIQQSAKTNDFNLSPHDIDTLYQLGQNDIYKEALKGDVHHELPFMVKEDNEILHGYIDFISIQSDKITIIDYKSDALSSNKDFIIAYKEQLHSYKKAIQIMYPNTIITCYIYSLHLAQMIAI